jgi:hypothetical protein
MSHSYLCAISGQSIPVFAIEPTEVVVLLPDGAIMHGVWDGYGHILPSGISVLQSAHDIARYETPEYHLAKRLAMLLGVEESDDAAIAAAVKMIKAKYYEVDKHTFSNTEVSKPCPKHGLLYKAREWNEPRRAATRNLPPWLRPAEATDAVAGEPT